MVENLLSSAPTLSNLIKNNEAYGAWAEMLYGRMTAATTAATVNSGGNSMQRYPNTFTVPSVGAGVNGYVLTAARMVSEDISTQYILGLEYNLGDLTISGNSFSDGVAMPTKRVFGEDIATATIDPFIVITTTLVATNPVVTVTYTNQNGNTGNTAALTIPTNAAVNSAFAIQPHMAADLGIKDVTNISTSAGTGGALSVRGLLRLATCQSMVTAGLVHPVPVMGNLSPKFLCEPGETLAIYRQFATTTNELVACVWGMPE